MIRFSCKCEFAFNVTDDQAGAMVQCPRCGLLVDVPTAEELAWMAQDGAAAADAGPAGQTLSDLYRAYGRKHTDADGRPIDLRPDADHYRRLGDAPSSHRPQRIAPRYDPATGERIVPLALKDEPPQPVLPMGVLVDDSELDPVDLEFDDDGGGPVPVMAIPVGAVPVIPVRPAARSAPSLGYATGDAGWQATLRSEAVDLLVVPANLTVLFFVFWFYVAAVAVRDALALLADNLHLSHGGLALLNVPLWLLAAHYGCVVEDVGPDAIDELPRPLRNFSVGDDLFAPGVRVALALAICYGPAAVFAAATGLARPAEGAIAAAAAGLGSVAFPAVVLTLLTGTTVLNLTPGRVIGVVAACGPQYGLAVAGAAAVLALTAGVVLGPGVLPPLAAFPAFRVAQRFTLLVPALALTAYVTHLFAWHLGLMYRAHHDSFPWLAQRHIRTPRPDRPLPRAG